jgi:DNA-binding IclR family transcriptional regulator
MQILSCFREDSPLLGNQEIAGRCGLPKSTVSRFTYTLTKIDCLEFDGRFGKYRLGSRVLSLGHTMLAGFDVADHILPYMRRLGDLANALVTLAMCEDFSMVCVAAARSASSLAPPIEPGTHVSIATTAMGRAYLASASRSERDRIVKHLAKTKAASWKAMEKDLAATFREYAKHGYCTTIEGWRKGHNGVAVPLYLKNYGRRVVLSCGGPAFQLPREAIVERVGPSLLRVANEIEVSFEKLLA